MQRQRSNGRRSAGGADGRALVVALMVAGLWMASRSVPAAEAVSPWANGGASATAKTTDTDGKPAASTAAPSAPPTAAAGAGAVPVAQAMAFPAAVITGGTIPPGWQPQAVSWPAIGPDGRPTSMVVAPTYTFTYAIGPPVMLAMPVNRPQAVMRPVPAPGWNYATQSLPPPAYQLPTQVARPATPWQYPAGAPALAGQPIVPPGPPLPVYAPPQQPYPPPVYAGPPPVPQMVGPQSAPQMAGPPPFIQGAQPDQWVAGGAAVPAPPNVGQPPAPMVQSLAALAPPAIAGAAAAAGQASSSPPPTALVSVPQLAPQAGPQTAPQMVPLGSGNDLSPPQSVGQSPTPPAGRSPTVHAWRVVGVHDGDTITCLDENNVQQKVRLAEIDAPEIGQDYGKVSREALADLVFGKTVQVVDQGKDRYGRWIGRVSVGGTDVNRQLVATGNAWHYSAYSQDASLAGLQAQAQAQRKGLWAQADPVAPWDYRKAGQLPATT
ncbi:MAG: thermonuclease family protein [Pirellulales bacterium]